MSWHSGRLLGRLIVTAALGIGAALAFPFSAAQAALIDLSACNGSALSQPFAPWGDMATYELAPGGDFQTGAWSLDGGAQRTFGGEPYAATGSRAHWSLTLPAGSSAQSPPTCVDAAYPTIRFFIAGAGSVAVSLVDGNVEVPAGVAVTDSSWQPTPVMVTTAPLLGTASGGVAQVSLRLTALTGDPSVDDVFIDPWNRR